MSALPLSLQPWRQWLDWFGPEPAALLGDLLLRMNPLLGGASARAQGGRLDPDGIDDLRKRGPYERLVLSEWMLADSLPDEFVRRAANSEHLFLAPKLVNHVADSVLLAVFDAGPSQWGAARLVHVAMWILLARRAQALGARFLWGLAHAPGSLHGADTPSMLQQLLRGRGHELASAEHRQAWHAHFTSSGQMGSERWLVAAEHPAEASFSHALSVRRGFNEELRISIGTRNARRSTRLALPPGPQAARILSGHFLSAASSTAHRGVAGRFSLRQPPLWNASGERVSVPLLGESRAVVFRVQEESAAKRAAPRYMQWSEQADVLTVALSQKSHGAIIADPYHLHFWNIPDLPAVKRPEASEFAVTPGLSRWLRSAWMHSGGNAHRFLVLDNGGSLHAWLGSSKGKAGGAHELVDRDVVTLTQPGMFHLLYVRHHQAHLLVNAMHSDGRTLTITRLPLSERPASVTLCGGPNFRNWNGAVCVEHRIAKRDGDRSVRCSLFQSGPDGSFRATELKLAPESKVLGVARDAREAGQHLVLALSPDRRALVGVGPRGAEPLYHFAANVSVGSVSGNGDRVALIDLGGQLHVLADGGRRLVMCLRGQQEPASE